MFRRGYVKRPLDHADVPEAYLSFEASPRFGVQRLSMFVHGCLWTGFDVDYPCTPLSAAPVNPRHADATCCLMG
jgi:hypothetical protein